MKTHVLLRCLTPLAASLLLSGLVPRLPPALEREIDALTQRGFTVQRLTTDLIELTDPLSGEKHLRSLSEPSDGQVRAWASSRGIPILEIDPNMIDTGQFSGWFTYWATVPLGNGIGNPLVVGDLNHDQQTDLYGVFLDTLSTDSQARVYEVDSLGNVFFRHEYVPRQGGSRLVTDVDRDSMLEVVFSFGGVISGYEQLSSSSLPTNLMHTHDRFYHNSQAAGPNTEFIGTLDGDNLTDLLYQGTGPDPSDTSIAIAETYVAEYDTALENFVRVWSIQFYPNSGAHGFTVGNFDQDGMVDFVATHASGKVYLAENVGDNDYATAWNDSTPFVNFYEHGSGDVDYDTRMEFFAGAVMSNGSWTLMYEADSNDSYSAKFLFHLLSGGLLAGAQYLTPDMNGDGKLELAIKVGGELYIFKSTVNDTYHLWYLRREGAMDGVTFYDFNNDGRQDIVISRFVVNSEGRGRLYADIYTATTLVSVAEEERDPSRITLKQSYPNPFNPTTILSFTLPHAADISLVVYDVQGRRITEIANGYRVAGDHTVVWDAARYASGVYFARFTAIGESGGVVYSKVNKLLLMK